MPLLRALGRWYRRMTVGDDAYYDDRGAGVGSVSGGLSGVLATLAAIIALPVALVVGGAYEIVRLVDRPNVLGSRGQWVAAVVIAVVALAVVVLALRPSA